MLKPARTAPSCAWRPGSSGASRTSRSATILACSKAACSECDDVSTAVRAGRRLCRNCRRALNTAWRNVEYPCKNKCDRKADQQKHDDRTNHRIRDLKNRKNLSKTLGKRPAGDDVRDR